MVSRLSNKNPRDAQENWKKSEARHLQRFSPAKHVMLEIFPSHI